MDSPSIPSALPSVQRSFSLDALRGFAILTMVLSGVIPYYGLPAWMYHAQLPPPTRAFDPTLPGLTWVDLVFPMFLFALGAAIPLALGKRLAKGDNIFKIIRQVVERTLLLGFFAIFSRHVRPHVMNPEPDPAAWGMAMFGFLLMFGLYARFPEKWSAAVKRIIRITGWSGAILFLALIRYPDGSGFSLDRSDIILVVLTNAYFFGALVWLLTQQKIVLRLGVIGVLLALRLAHTESGWVNWLWDFSPIPWIYQLYYLQYLLIVIPGTIIGDLYVNYAKNTSGTLDQKWSQPKYLFIMLVMLLFVLTNLTGLQARWLVQNLIICLLLSIICWRLVRHAGSRYEQLIRTLSGWGIYLLLTGLTFEPFEGGIKKDHSTVSYYLVTAGLSILLLIAFSVLVDFFKKQKWMRWLIDNGQNPMIAYVGFANFIWPVLALAGLETLFQHLTPTAWSGFLRGVLYTGLLAAMVTFFTRKKIFWKT